MAEIFFNYEGNVTMIQSNLNDKMKNVIDKYISKIGKNANNLIFLYDGQIVNEDLSFQKQASNLDLSKEKMNILVLDVNQDNEKESIILSNELICPECRENIIINIKDYKINYECKKEHDRNYILLNEYDKSQKIDLAQIICDRCKEINKSNSYKNQFFYCCTCKLNLCPLCNNFHDKTHNIVNYDDKRYICLKHKESIIKYCKKCKENMCFLCENEHKEHDILNLSEIMINKNDLLKELEDFKIVIDKFKTTIEKMKKSLNTILNNIEKYYKINLNIINNFNIKRRNYEVIQNINELKDFNKKIFKDLNDIINEDNMYQKFFYVINIYSKINNLNIKNITNKEAEILYDNGEKYIGGINNGLRNGFGTMYFNKDDKREKYVGDWKNGLKDGKGILYFKSGNRYEGDFINDIREGKGIYYYKSGDRYEGDFKNEKPEGKGIYYHTYGEFKGDRFEGYFKNSKKEGKGMYYHHNGDRQMGDFSNDKPIGKHVTLKANGEITSEDYSE